MITVTDGVFRLDTAATSYWFRVTEFGHLEQMYYGSRLPADQPITALGIKRSAEIGTTVVHPSADQADPLYALDNLCLEWSGIGVGDYRESPIEVVGADGSYRSDFIYISHAISDGVGQSNDLPLARIGDEPRYCSEEAGWGMDADTAQQKAFRAAIPAGSYRRARTRA
ncbi:MAG: hypothetical protein LBE83_08845, partial [Propionibacteriaceae bacterium]|nr:hypothetical protein [Propionibacteriaceae bacterium]